MRTEKKPLSEILEQTTPTENYVDKDKKIQAKEQRTKKILINLTVAEYNKIVRLKEQEGKKYMPDAIYAREKLLNID